MNETLQHSISREIPAAASVIFELLADPARHDETDASGMVQAVREGGRLTDVGDTFVMDMHKEDGPYQTVNEVFAFVDGRVIGWKNLRNSTAGVDVGSKWLYELDPVDDQRTLVTLTYDRSEIDNPEVFAMSKNFDEAALEPSLAKLAEAVA